MELDRGELDQLCVDAQVFELAEWQGYLAKHPKFRRLSVFGTGDIKQVLNHVEMLKNETERERRLTKRFNRYGLN